MHIIHTKDPKEGVASLAETIGNSLKEGRNVLWVLCGGSNIAYSVDVMNMLQSFVSKKDMPRLTVTLSDERFGPVAHKDSNWQQLLDKGFDITNVQVLPVLVAVPAEQDLEKTKEEFSIKVKKAYNKADIIIGQLGLGADGHIAGVLPESRGVVDTSVAVAYEANDFKRITLTLKMIKKMSVIFVFAFGESKKSVVADLETKDLSMSQMPAQILRQVKDVRMYCD